MASLPRNYPTKFYDLARHAVHGFLPLPDIDVGAVQDVRFKLAVAGVSAVVEVTAQAPLIESTKTDVSTLVNEEDPNNQFIDAALGKASRITPGKIKELGLGSFIYAGLFLIEGIGLWFEKRWAEVVHGNYHGLIGPH